MSVFAPGSTCDTGGLFDDVYMVSPVLPTALMAVRLVCSHQLAHVLFVPSLPSMERDAQSIGVVDIFLGAVLVLVVELTAFVIAIDHALTFSQGKDYSSNLRTRAGSAHCLCYLAADGAYSRVNSLSPAHPLSVVRRVRDATSRLSARIVGNLAQCRCRRRVRESLGLMLRLLCPLA